MISQEKIWDSLYKKDENKWKLESPLPKILRGKKVLEIGAGNGKTLKSILSQKPLQVTAIDISSEAIKIIKSKFKSKTLTSLQASVGKIPLENNYFDIVVCFFTLNNLLIKERKIAIKEIFRVIKKGGILIFSDFADGDYRINGKNIEDNTVLKSTGLILHAFTIKEVKSFFKGFKIDSLKIISSRPIRNQPALRRKRVFLIAKK